MPQLNQTRDQLNRELYEYVNSFKHLTLVLTDKEVNDLKKLLKEYHSTPIISRSSEPICNCSKCRKEFGYNELL